MNELLETAHGDAIPERGYEPRKQLLACNVAYTSKKWYRFW